MISPVTHSYTLQQRVRSGRPALASNLASKTMGSINVANNAATKADLKRICVFCGSKHGVRPGYAQAAKSLASELVKQNIGLVYGGGTVGLMGEIATSVADGLGPSGVLGFIPEAMTPKEAAMASHSDGFIAMPGGFGTLEELLEVMTWQALGFHAKPVGLLNVEGFYDGLLGFFKHCVEEGFVEAKYNGNVLVAEEPQELLRLMQEWQPPASSLLADRMARSAAIGQDISGASGASR